MRFFVCSETFNHQLVIPFFCTIFPAKWSKTSGFWSMPWSYLCCTEVWCLPYFFYLYKELNSATLPARSHLDFCWLTCLFLWTLWPLQHRFLCWPLPFFTEEFFFPSQPRFLYSLLLLFVWKSKLAIAIVSPNAFHIQILKNFNSNCFIISVLQLLWPLMFEGWKILAVAPRYLLFHLIETKLACAQSRLKVIFCTLFCNVSLAVKTRSNTTAAVVCLLPL